MQKINETIANLLTWIREQYLKFGRWVEETMLQMRCAIEAVWSMLHQEQRDMLKDRLMDEYNIRVNDARVDAIDITIAA